jgi:hypothetical protein
MCFLVQRCCLLGRRAQPIRAHWRFTWFAALLCLCALSGIAGAQEPPKGLSEEQVIKLLKDDPPARVQYLVNKYGISFSFTPDIEKELTQAGATPELLDLVRRLAPAKPAEVKAPPPPPPPAPAPVLVINAKPGEAEVYVDDERRGETSRSGTLRVSGLAAGLHQLRLSLPGYHSFEVSVELNAGETNTVVATLLPESPPAAPKEEPTAGGSANSKAAPAAAAPAKPAGDPDDPLTPHPAGIYYLQQQGSAHKLVELEQAPSAQRSASARRGGGFGGFAGMGGGGLKWKSLIYGSKARFRVAAGRPVFYFYFPAPDANPGSYDASDGVFRPSSSPNGFLLVHLESKKNEREIPTKGSVTATVQANDLVPFDYEKIAPGTYKVQLKSDLGAGEYGFLFGGVLQAMGDAALYDFGIDKIK